MKNKTIPIIFVTLSISFFTFVFYKSEIIHGGIKIEYYSKYYYLALIFSVFSLISFFLKKDFLMKIFIISISLIFSLYLIEAYFFLTSFEKKQNRISKSKLLEIKKSKLPYDFRSKYEFYKDSKKSNPEFVLSVNPEIFKKQNNKNIFPFSGISYRPTVHGNENGYYTFYLSDRYGFNNHDADWDEKEIDYLLLGDSFIHGAFVNEKDSIAGNLRNKNKNTVINLSYKGNGPLIKFATLREYLDKTKPKKVLWFYFEGNDLYELTDELQNKTLAKYLQDDLFKQNLPLKQNIIDEIILSELKKLEKKNFKKFLKLNNVRSITIEKTIKYPDWEQKISNEFFEIIKKTKNILEKKNIQFYFVYLPEYDRYSKNLGDDKIYNDYGKVINKISNLGVNIIDIHEEVFSVYPDPLALFPFRSDGHYNETGYTLIGKKILDLLNKP